MVTWLRRLFGRGGQARSFPTPASERRSTHAAPGAPGTAAPPAGPAFSVQAPLAEPADPADRLAARLDRIRHTLDASPADRPLHALLDLLAAGCGAGIRQLPSAALEAMRACREADGDLRVVTGLCERDPALTQAVLRYANSAYYTMAGTDPCTSIAGAVARVGTAGVGNVLVQLTVGSMLCRPGGTETGMVEQVWQHMVRTAPLARSLARGMGADPEAAFAAGLLHDVGKLAVFDHLTALRATERRLVPIPAAFLRLVLHRLHEPLGGLAGRSWGLAGPLVAAIESHHRDPVPPEADLLAEAVYVAERADLAACRGETPDVAGWCAAGRITTAPERVAALLTYAATADAT